MSFKYFQKPDADQQERVPPGQYLAKNFPVLSASSPPKIDLTRWRLKVWGLVQEQSFTWSEMMKLPQHQFTADFHCVTRWSKLDVKWTGIKITDFLDLLEIESTATHVLQHCYGGYTTNVTFEDFKREENFLAIALNSEPLSQDRGYPMRTVIPHLYAWKSAKWING
jgi:DMSO/TMAO reductase YedYZ molybdopterin-dependent catalytic subunit